jgi:fructoselysine-6-P-deglycase FrlB-like protein
MTEMIAAEPALAERLVRRLTDDPELGAVTVALETAAAEGRPIVTTGCGTSEHGAMIAAALLTDALEGATAWPMQALEVARRPPRDGSAGGLARGRNVGDERGLKAAHAAGRQRRSSRSATAAGRRPR